MKKKILGLFVFLGCISLLSAQDEKPDKVNKGHNIGAYVGASSGYGISYRYFPKTLGFQVTTTPIFGSDNAHVSVGGMLLLSFNRTKFTNLFGYIGYHYQYDKNEYNDEYSSYYSKNVSEFSATGLGVGFELSVAERVGFNWHLGYAYYINSDKYNNEPTNTDWRMFIDAGTGIFYKF